MPVINKPITNEEILNFLKNKNYVVLTEEDKKEYLSIANTVQPRQYKRLYIAILIMIIAAVSHCLVVFAQGLKSPSGIEWGSIIFLVICYFAFIGAIFFIAKSSRRDLDKYLNIREKQGLMYCLPILIKDIDFGDRQTLRDVEFVGVPPEIVDMIGHPAISKVTSNKDFLPFVFRIANQSCTEMYDFCKNIMKNNSPSAEEELKDGYLLIISESNNMFAIGFIKNDKYKNQTNYHPSHQHNPY